MRVRVSKAGKSRHIVLTEEGREFFAALPVGRPGSARLFLRANGKAWGKSEQQRPLTAACARGPDRPACQLPCASPYLCEPACDARRSARRDRGAARPCRHPHGRKALWAPVAGYVAETVRAAFGSLGLVEPSNIVAIRVEARNS